MASPLFRFPNAGAPTTTLTFRDGAVISRGFEEAPVQFNRIAEAGNIFTFTPSANLELRLLLEVSDLQEADASGFSGYNSLITFLRTTVTWSALPFDFTDADGDTETVRYWDGFRTLRQARRATFWSGELILFRDL